MYDAAINSPQSQKAAVGAALNVRINLGSIEDADYVRRTAAELDAILAEAAALRAEVLATTLAKI